jgi:arylsulfatase A-like enzyme
MRFISSFLVTVFVTASSQFVDTVQAAARPNIVLIMADDLGFSDLGCYGGEIETPHLDRLASEGLRFTQFYNCAVCVATRAALLTGTYPRLGRQRLLDHDMITLAQALKGAGYQTSLTGKWHSGNDSERHPLSRGFDEWYGLGSGCSNHFDPSIADPKFYNGGNSRPFFHNREPVTQFPADFYSTDAFANHAVDSIRRFAKSGPFFVHVCFTAPHFPLHAPPEDVAKYRGRYDDGYFALRERRFRRQQELGIVGTDTTLSPVDHRLGDWKYDYEIAPWDAVANRERETRRMEVYAAMVDRLDRGVGKILSALEAAGVADDTLVMFLSDNGGCGSEPEDVAGHAAYNAGKLPGPKDTYDFCGAGWGWAQCTPFRRFKTWCYEGGIATPLIVRGPGVVGQGKITHEPGHVVDFMPTLLELAGGAYPREVGSGPILPLEGRSLVPILSGKPWDSPRQLAWFLFGNRAYRDGHWKLTWGVTRKQWELFDLAADRSESHDLAAEHPERLAKMSAAWQQWARSVGVDSLASP